MIKNVIVGSQMSCPEIDIIGRVIQVFENDEGIVDSCLVRNYDNMNVYMDLTEFSPGKDMRH